MAAKSYLGVSNLPRGIRNNNPGNLRISTETWIGKIDRSKNTDKSFEQFIELRWGIRAMMRNIITAINTKKLDTIRKLITKYAPPEDNNDTEAYISAVVRKVGISDRTVLGTDQATLIKLTTAIIEHENGANTYKYITPDDIQEGYSILYAKGYLEYAKKKVIS
ncbi:MAG: structural protein [Bacteroidia bacterium]|nr:structural protein [Bacteroidia bacterium]